ncbi:MAG: hypothetical protein IT247_09570 [Bacteroidia bacterium]|nr:hypothetical protein [Bacteroidia bacterium]
MEKNQRPIVFLTIFLQNQTVLRGLLLNAVARGLKAEGFLQDFERWFGKKILFV